MAHVDEAARTTIAVVGCGNPNRSDDGIGPEVIQLLTSRGLARDPGVRLLDAGTDGMAVLFGARGCRSLIIVDACRTGSEPGTIFEVPGHELETHHDRTLTLHDFRWDHALYAARRMFTSDFPADVTVFLVEAETIDFGIGLSPQAIKGSRAVADRIAARVRARLGAAEALS